MEKPLLIHIHSDSKFLDSVGVFENDQFRNEMVFLGAQLKYQGKYKNKILHYKFSPRSLKNLIRFCSKARMVILYELNFPKAYIANKLPESVIVVWRFFGTELYRRIPEQLHSEKTLEILNCGSENRLSGKLKEVMAVSSWIVKFRTQPEKEFNNAAFKRANYFLGISRMEYDFLKMHWPGLPEFMQLCIPFQATIKNRTKFNSNIVIVGNNRSAYNNHIDIIENIKLRNSKKEYQFKFLFNYGINVKYSDYIRRKTAGIKEVQRVENYLSFNDFKELYIKADAFVLNGYRQMGMRNILEALTNNVKIYLNEKNVIYHWLKSAGLAVFTIENFYSDLDMNNITLSEEEIRINEYKLNSLSKEYSRENFHIYLMQILRSQDNSLII